MRQHRLRPCAVFTETAEECAPYYLAEICHDLSQTTVCAILGEREWWIPPREITRREAPVTVRKSADH
jgi:hypothetical protein